MKADTAIEKPNRSGVNFPVEGRMKKVLQKRTLQGTFRSLKPESGLVDFCSNDYLGFAQSLELKNKVSEFNLSEFQNVNGSSGSRLLTGNSTFAERLEKEIARYHKAETTLIFNSGYDANLGLISAVIRKDSTIIYDEYIHASIHDGIRMSKAVAAAFKHNSLQDLEARLSQADGYKFVAVESLYSMDGDLAPLQEIVQLCGKYGAQLIVDEAHAVGLHGSKGEGRVVELGLEKEIFARLVTFGKALGCHGAAVLGSELLRTYLINFARSFIYTTAMPIHALISIKSAYDMLSVSDDKKLITRNLTKLFKQEIKGVCGVHVLPSETQIQGVIVPGNERVRSVAAQIQNHGFDVRPLVHPTVPKGEERIRICLHAFNTEEEIKGLVKSIQKAVQS